MKWLLIDDLRNFQNGVVPSDVQLYVARNSEEALQLLNDHPDGFEKMFFDHDLGGDDTTRPVVLFLEESAYFGDTYRIDEVVIHTSNNVGRDWISNALNRIYDIRKIDARSVFIA